MYISDGYDGRLERKQWFWFHWSSWKDTTLGLFLLLSSPLCIFLIYAHIHLVIFVSTAFPAYNLVILSNFQVFKYILSFSMLSWAVSHVWTCRKVSPHVCPLSPDCMLLVSRDGVRPFLPLCRAGILWKYGITSCSVAKMAHLTSDERTWSQAVPYIFLWIS